MVQEVKAVILGEFTKEAIHPSLLLIEVICAEGLPEEDFNVSLGFHHQVVQRLRQNGGRGHGPSVCFGHVIGLQARVQGFGGEHDGPYYIFFFGLFFETKDKEKKDGYLGRLQDLRKFRF